jgi:hypothetical protein
VDFADNGKTITTLPDILTALTESQRDKFDRIYDVIQSTGEIVPPSPMYSWLTAQFGSVEKTLQQRIIRVINKITHEEALFNELRASRPLRKREEYVADLLDDPLAQPLENTPEDLFGRIKGRYSVTAGNVAKYEGLHGIVVFTEPEPLRFDREQITDYLMTALKWIEKAHESDRKALYPFIMWNCGARAGASLHHGHMQVMLAKKRHYTGIEQLRADTLLYHAQYDSSYWTDLFDVHHALGCGLKKNGVKVLAHLTPAKEKEVLLIATDLYAITSVMYEVLACFRDAMNVRSFNMAIYMVPVQPVEEDWTGFPVLARIVDRGDPKDTSSDIGSVEMFASRVIASDPFKVARSLHTCL